MKERKGLDFKSKGLYMGSLSLFEIEINILLHE